VKKRYLKKNNNKIRFSLGTLVLMLFCTFLLIVSTFIQFDMYFPIIPSEQERVHGLTFASFWGMYTMIPQVPSVVFVGALLGRSFALASVVIYILMGLFLLPVFALGGGLNYFSQYGFGYILAYMPAVWFLATQLKNGLNVKNIALGVLWAILIIHVFGMFYMSVVALVKGDGFAFIKSWIVNQSGWKIVFDYVLSFAFVYFTKLLQPIMWCFKKPY